MHESKAFLLQIEKINRQIRNKEKERDQWRDIALAVSPKGGGDKVKSTSNQQKMANAVEKYVDLEKEIDGQIDKLIDTKAEIISVIEKLNTNEYDLIYKRYIQGMTLAEIAFAEKKSYSWATALHGIALENIKEIRKDTPKKS